MKVPNENKTSKDPIIINTKLNKDETKSATIGVPPLFTVVPLRIKKPSRLNPKSILAGIIMKAFRILIKEKMAITVTIMAPLFPKTTFATSAAAKGEFANEATGNT
jgi:hypothetical protein